jgi:hypothetical protein
MAKRHKILGVMLLAAAPGAALGQIQPQDLASQRAQTQSQLNQQNTQTQLGNLQLQQGMAQDRQREHQLFTPQTPAPRTPTPPPPAPPLPTPKTN